MHPSKDILERFVHGLVKDEANASEIRDHITECDFCREYCENYANFLESVDSMAGDALAGAAKAQEEELFRQAMTGRIISLKPFLIEFENAVTYLAADGTKEKGPRVQNLATLYSEDPEIILRLMRDLDRKFDYVQVVSDDPALTGNVMIQLPDFGWEFLTDETGRAVLDDVPSDDWEKLKWQIKLPDAVFALEPLAYDPERVEGSSETILETPGGDKLKVVFEERTEGNQVSLQLLQLKGKVDFGTAKVIVSTGSVSVTREMMPDRVVSVGTLDLSEKINIRFFV